MYWRSLMSRKRYKKVSFTAFDVCVLAYNNQEYLNRCLDSIEKEIEATGFNCSVNVLDNGSDERLDLSHPVITNSKRINQNIGFPGGANTVINMGNSPIAIFISDDITLLPGSLGSIYTTMVNQPLVGLCGFKLLFDGGGRGKEGTVQHIAHAVNIKGEITHPLIGWDKDNPKCCISREVFSVTGAAFAVRRDVWRKSGGFDEIYSPGTYEDVELALKIRQLRYKIYIDTNAMATHTVGGTVRQDAGFPLNRNREIFRLRWSKFLSWDEWRYW